MKKTITTFLLLSLLLIPFALAAANQENQNYNVIPTNAKTNLGNYKKNDGGSDNKIEDSKESIDGIFADIAIIGLYLNHTSPIVDEENSIHIKFQNLGNTNLSFGWSFSLMTPSSGSGGGGCCTPIKPGEIRTSVIPFTPSESGNHTISVQSFFIDKLEDINTDNNDRELTFYVKDNRPFCEGDTNNDRIVNDADIDNVEKFWGISGDDGDANGDGQVNMQDILSILSNWGSCDQ